MIKYGLPTRKLSVVQAAARSADARFTLESLAISLTLVIGAARGDPSQLVSLIIN